MNKKLPGEVTKFLKWVVIDAGQVGEADGLSAFDLGELMLSNGRTAEKLLLKYAPKKIRRAKS